MQRRRVVSAPAWLDDNLDILIEGPMMKSAILDSLHRKE